MGNEAHRLLEAALALSRDERRDLAEKLLASIEGEVSNAEMYGEYTPDPDIERAWAAEIVRRLERIASGETVLVPGEQVDAEVRRILAGK